MHSSADSQAALLGSVLNRSNSVGLSARHVIVSLEHWEAQSHISSWLPGHKTMSLGAWIGPVKVNAVANFSVSFPVVGRVTVQGAWKYSCLLVWMLT